MVNRGALHSISAVENKTRAVFSSLLDLVFPNICISCKTIGQRICDSCADTILWIDSGCCLHCGLPLETDPNHLCIDPSRLQFIRSAAVFSGTMRKAVHSLKYYSDFALAGRLIQLAHGHWFPPTWEFDALIPVPLGKRREDKRGYNQSLLLAEALSRIVKIPVAAKCLMRIRETQTQVGLSYASRRQNVADAFRASSVPGKRVLLVDDVCTTGSTLQSCADALLRAGCFRVGALTLARAILPSSRLDVHENPIQNGGLQ